MSRHESVRRLRTAGSPELRLESLPDDVLDCWSSLEQERDAWKAVRDLKVSILGGAWTRATTGRDLT